MPETSTKKKPNGTGRKKIEIKKIEKNSSRKVAFSKRRKGLFKKGAELCRLCDAMIAIIVFSPKGRVYTFGHPSPDYVIDQFLAEEVSEEDPFPRETDDEDCVVEEENSDKETNEDDDDAMDVNDELEKSSEKEPENSEENSEKEPEISNDDGGGRGEGFWWEESMEDLNVEELEKYKICMEMFRYNLGMMLEEMMLRRTSERDLLGAG